MDRSFKTKQKQYKELKMIVQHWCETESWLKTDKREKQGKKVHQ